MKCIVAIILLVAAVAANPAPSSPAPSKRQAGATSPLPARRQAAAGTTEQPDIFTEEDLEIAEAVFEQLNQIPTLSQQEHDQLMALHDQVAQLVIGQPIPQSLEESVEQYVMALFEAHEAEIEQIFEEDQDLLGDNSSSSEESCEGPAPTSPAPSKRQAGPAPTTPSNSGESAEAVVESREDDSCEGPAPTSPAPSKRQAGPPPSTTPRN
jgi:hypothetical protein